MLKKLFAILLTLSMLFTTAILLAACAAKDGVPKEAKELFQKYMDACATDMHEALKYVRTVTDIDLFSADFYKATPGTYKMLKWQNQKITKIL